MKDDIKIKVLWIDDQPTDSFKIKASFAGIDIVVAEDVKTGMKLLEDTTHTFEAIILDANCKIGIDENETEDISALSHAIAGIYVRRIEIPWFVYTAGAIKDKKTLEAIIPQTYRNWDNKYFYAKPGEINELFDAIKKAVKDQEITKTKRRYSSAFKAYDGLELLNLLLQQKEQTFNNDQSVPKTIRFIAENICHKLSNLNIISCPNQSNIINGCSIFIGTKEAGNPFPLHIKGAFHFLSQYYCNPGSHAGNPQKEPVVCSFIQKGDAPYLNQMGLNALLSILDWYSSLPFNDDEAMSPFRKFYNQIANKH